MSSIEILGIIAAVVTTISFLPQTIKTIKSKNTKDLSLSMYSILFVGICLWLVYGYLIGDIPIMLANGVTLVLTGLILLMKIKYK